MRNRLFVHKLIVFVLVFILFSNRNVFADDVDETMIVEIENVENKNSENGTEDDSFQEGYFSKDDQTYYADRKGVLQSGWIKVGDVWRYFEKEQGCSEVLAETEDGYWYDLQDGRRCYFEKQSNLIKNSWKTIEGQRYYFDENGFVVKGWHQDGNAWYYAQENGEMVKGVWSLGDEGKQYYFNDDYCLSTGWKKIDGVYRFFQTNEKVEECCELIFDKQIGWVISEDERICYIDGKTGAVTGWKTLEDGFRYHFDTNGFLDTGFFQEGKYFYYAENEQTATEDSPLGNVVKGIKVIDDGIYGFHPTKYYRLSGWQVIDGEKYYFRSNCEAVIGWYSDGNSWYYAETEEKETESGCVPKGAMVKGVVQIENNTYYFDAENRLKTGWIKIDGEWRYFETAQNPENCYEIEREKESGWSYDGKYNYYVDENGTKAKGVIQIGNHTYYFDTENRLKTGWIKINGEWRYFEKANKPELCYEIPYILSEKWMILTDETGRKSYITEKKSLQKGWLKLEGNKYYFDASGFMKTGYFSVDGKKYYADETGNVTPDTRGMKNCWWENEGETYYFNSKGNFVKGFQTIGKKKFYFNDQGVLQTGWFFVGTGLYYGEPETNEAFMKGTLAAGAKEIADANGSETYFFHKEQNYRVTGWQTNGKQKYYLKSDGKACTGWFAVDGKVYYGETETVDKETLKGAVVKGIKVINNKLYIFHSSKYYRVTGWQTVNKKKYYVGTDGIVRTGWFKVGGKWYYGEPEMTNEGVIQGTLASGFKEIVCSDCENTTVHTYYFDSNHRLVTGWKTISKITYFFQNDEVPQKCYMICKGPNKKGWFTFEDGRISYLNAKGKFVTGWQTIGGKKYYFDTDGIMSTGWCTIDGIEYYFNSDGQYISLKNPVIESATSTEYGTAVIRWKAVPEAKSFLLQYSKDRAFPSWKTTSILISDASFTEQTFEGLDVGETYYFRIKYTLWDENEGGLKITSSSYSKEQKLTIKGEDEPTATSANIVLCEMEHTNNDQEISVKLQAEFNNQKIKSADENYYIVEIESFGNALDVEEAVAKVEKSNRLDVSFDISQNTERALMNKYAIAIKREDGTYQIISEPAGISNPECLAENREPILKATSKKGLQGIPLDDPNSENDALGTNSKQTLFNLDLMEVIGVGPGEGYIEYSYKGKTYYFSNCSNLIYEFQQLEKGCMQYIQGITGKNNKVCVTLNLLLSYDAQKDYLIDPAARVKGRSYYLMNVREEEARETFEAVFLYLGEIFGQKDCYVTNWILGNEVNSSKAWNYSGKLSQNDYMKCYASAFRLLYNGVKSTKTGNNVFISLDNGWTAAPDTYTGKSTLDKFADYAQKENPNMNWSIAYHGYSYPLTRCDFWNDSTNTTNKITTKYISMKNISVLTDYAAALEEKYGKEPESIRVILSEQGYNAGKGSEIQAKAIARGYYMAEFNDRIDAFIIRAVIDAEEEVAGKLFLGIQNRFHEKRISFYVYEYMDSNLEKFYETPVEKISVENKAKVEHAKEILCTENWEELIPGFDRNKLNAMY